MTSPIRILVVHNRHWGHIAYISGLDKADIEMIYVDEDELHFDGATDDTRSLDNYRILPSDMQGRLAKYGYKEE